LVDDRSQLEDLLEALVNSSLDDEGLVQLTRLLDGDDEAQLRYIEMLDLHQSIRWQITSTATFESVRSLRSAGLDVNDQPVVLRTLPFRWGWAAAAAVLIGLISLGLVMRRPEGTPPSARVEPPVSAPVVDAVAQVVDAQNAIWAEPVVGALGAGSHQLESGQATVVFQDGTQLVIKGPAEFQVTQSSLELRDGTVLLRSRSGSQGNARNGFRFTLKTPTLVLREVGTEAGVSVIEGVSRVAVFRGQVMATVTERHVGIAQQLRLTRDDGLEVTADGVVISGIVADVGLFESLRSNKPQTIVANASFEFPKAEGVSALAAAGWNLLSHPVANANPMKIGAGVLHAGLVGKPTQELPSPSDGVQWAYLSARTLANGRTAYASMHQEVGEVEHATTYRLGMTVGWPRKGPGASFTVALYAGSQGPVNPLIVWRDPVKPRGGRVGEVVLEHHVAIHSPYRGKKLFLVIEAVPGAHPGTRRVLIDNVRLETVDSDR
jgi:hypothetical protein